MAPDAALAAPSSPGAGVVVAPGSTSASAPAENSDKVPATKIDDATKIAPGQLLQKSDDDESATAGRVFGSFAGLVRNGTGKRNYGEKPTLKVAAHSMLADIRASRVACELGSGG